MQRSEMPWDGGWSDFNAAARTPSFNVAALVVGVITVALTELATDLAQQTAWRSMFS